MKKLINLSIILVMLLGFLPPQATANAENVTLWEQPRLAGGIYSSSSGSIMAEDFTLTASASIAQVELWNSMETPPDIQLDFYFNTDTNLPGDPIRQETITNAVTVYDACPGGCPQQYRTTLTLANELTLVPGRYWVAIYSSYEFFGWEYASSSSLPGSAAKYGTQAWQSYESDLAFRLLGTQQTCLSSVVVTNTNDSETGSLRQAIADVCEGGTITFDLEPEDLTITLSSQLTIDKNLTIDGSALTNKVSISGNNLFRVFSITPSTTVTMDSLIITNGNHIDTYGNGGGINNQGTLTINNSSLISNTTSIGGGIYNGGTLSITNSSLMQNIATDGGGALSNAGVATLTGCTISENQAPVGAGVDESYGTLTVSDSTFSGNVASSKGGGIFISPGAQANIFGSTFVNNTAGEMGGGGIVNHGTSSVVNSTFTENVTGLDDRGSAINNHFGTLTLYNSTLSGNTGFVTLNNENGSMSLANTIIANTTSGWDCSTANGTLTESINNWVSDGATGGESCGAIYFDDPMLAALADNGGPTQTMALLEGSPAIDAGDDTICGGTLVGGVDQRGVTRPKDGDGDSISICDIGAYEYDGELPITNQPPVAYDYYAAFYQWLPTEPPGYTFLVPVMDPEGDDLTISYVSDTDPETEGVVNGVEVNCYYVDGCLAKFEFVGPTNELQVASMYITFQYRVNDGSSDSNTATVTLSFGEWPPSAEYGGKQLAAKDGTTRVRLIGEGYTSFIPGDYAFFIAKQSEHGSLGAPTVVACEIKSDEFYGEVYEWLVCNGEVLYTPEAGFGGEDSFDFVIFDGDSYSEQVTMRLWVADNGPPIAMDATDRVSANQPSQIILEARDPDWKMEHPDFWNFHDVLTFVIDKHPEHGSLGTPSEPICEAIEVDASELDYYALCRSTVLYTPAGDGATGDSFTFYVNDSHADSNTATVTLNLVEPSTLTVNATDDAGDGTCDETCTLRDAVLDAVPGDTIEFDLVLPNTITLNGKIVINKELTIVGPGANQLIIDGNEVEQWDDGGVFKLEAIWSEDLGSYQPIYVKISGLTIIGGRARAGGGIYNGYNCNLELSDCVIGPNNIVFDAGGGLANVGGTLYLNRCTVMDNHGTGSIGGAGIFTYNGADTTLVNSTVTGNVTNNHGGGILVWYDSAIHLVHSTVTGNTANADYVDYSWGGGGGIYAVVGDDSDPGGKVYIQNSIVAGNIDVTEPDEAKLPDVYGNFTSWGGNLIGDITGTSIESWLASDQVGTVAAPINPLLAELVLNSPGTTPTHALRTGSPAINAVECAYGVTVDQRGVTRPQPEGGACDIGAYEVEQTVTDTTPPEIAPHDDVTAEATSAAGAVVTYTSPATTDNVDDPGTATCEPISGSQFALGDTTVTCNATDAAGNAATPTTFVVHVVDTTKPVIAPHDDVTAEATSAAGAVVTYTNPATSDAVDGPGTATCEPVSGTQFALGDTTVTCNATDTAGNAATPTTFTVHVVDTTPPVIDHHDDVTAEATSAAGANVTYTSPATSDAVDGSGTATCEPVSGTQFALGDTTVTCNATDTAGNAAPPTTFVVRVVDTTAPEVTVPSNMTVPATDESGANVTFSATANDSVDGEITPTCVPSSGSLFPIGTTTVTCTATDSTGNKGQASFTVTVEVQTLMGESQLTSARTKCDVYAAGAADDLPRLFYTFTTNKKTLEDVLKSVTPSTFLYYVKATLPPEASTLVIEQTNDSEFPAMGASVTLYDENCARLSPQLASVGIVDGNITIDFVAVETERVVYVAVKYSARPIIGQIVTGWPDILYTFSAALDSSEPFTSADLEVIYFQ